MRDSVLLLEIVLGEKEMSDQSSSYVKLELNFSQPLTRVYLRSISFPFVYLKS